MSKFVELISTDGAPVVFDASAICALRTATGPDTCNGPAVWVYMRGGCGQWMVRGTLPEVQSMVEDARKPPQFELSAFEPLQLAPGTPCSPGIDAEAFVAKAEDALRFLASIASLGDRAREALVLPAPPKAMRGPA